MTEQRKHKQRIGQLKVFQTKFYNLFIIKSSVADLDPNPDADPLVPCVSGPPGSYHQANSKKTLIPTVL
jgi:hypothetical protein